MPKYHHQLELKELTINGRRILKFQKATLALKNFDGPFGKSSTQESASGVDRCLLQVHHDGHTVVSQAN